MVIVSSSYLQALEDAMEPWPRYFIGPPDSAKVYVGTQLADVAHFLQKTQMIGRMNHGESLVIERYDMSDLDLDTLPEIEAEEDPCDHGVVYVRELGMSTEMVRRKYPRLYGPCPKGCGFEGIAYASFEHFIAGDW